MTHRRRVHKPFDLADLLAEVQRLVLDAEERRFAVRVLMVVT